MTTDGVDAVVSSDIGASFCVREALSRGIAIPDELQIVAYDGTYLTDLAGMKLTAVAQDFSAIAQSAADHIVQAIANEEVAAANASRKNIPKPFEPNVLIPMTLILCVFMRVPGVDRIDFSGVHNRRTPVDSRAHHSTCAHVSDSAESDV